jgi:hypothetical protein
LSVRSTITGLVVIDEGRTLFFFFHDFPTTIMVGIKRLKSLLLLRNLTQ